MKPRNETVKQLDSATKQRTRQRTEEFSKRVLSPDTKQTKCLEHEEKYGAVLSWPVLLLYHCARRMLPASVITKNGCCESRGIEK